MTKYLPPKCTYTVEGSVIKTDGSVTNKVTGTMVAAILGLSPWSSPFQAACSLLGLAREDISDKPAVKTGQFLESRIIDFAGERYPEYGLFIPADEVYEKREGDHDSWASDFDDEVFGGHVDGIVMDNDGNDYILEIKTSANLDSWNDGVPEYYYWQVALYNRYLCNKDVAYVVLGIVDEETYKDPRLWVPTDDNVGLFRMEIDRAEVEEKLEFIRDWYSRYILNGTTPEYDPTNPKDVEMYGHLMSLADPTDAKGALVDRLASVEAMIDNGEKGLKGLYEARDSLRKDLKEYMSAHDMSALDSASGQYTAYLTEQVRTSVDPKKMEDAGIDPEPFIIRKVSKVFTVKESKVTKDGQQIE